LVIRQAVADDARAIAEVHVAAWRTTYPGIVAQAYIDGLSVDARTAAWDSRLRVTTASRSEILVAESGTDIVGFVAGGPIREPELGFDAELHAIYLHQTAQRMGLGRRLVSNWATIALGRGLTAAIVRVLARNSACRFYERLGARQVRAGVITIGDAPYPEVWYGWDDLHALTASPSFTALAQ
jgi:GNAT superfamily N-acetyltransferase